MLDHRSYSRLNAELSILIYWIGDVLNEKDFDEGVNISPFSQKFATHIFVCPFPGLVLCYRYLDWGLVQQGPGRAAVPSLTLFWGILI